MNVIRLALALATVASTAVLASGCGTTDADPERGRTLFETKCGTCHALAQAGTTAQAGPDLDAAFAAARASGMDSDTIEGIVARQIEYPRPSGPNTNPAVVMPKDLVTGQDRDDVAAYVGKYAGVPGAAPPKVAGGPGAQVFANSGCGGCHTLAAANAGGALGPNLDESLGGGVPESKVEEMIVEPNKEIAKGFQPNVMPPNYGQQLTPKELHDLVLYLIESTSGGSGAGSKRG